MQIARTLSSFDMHAEYSYPPANPISVSADVQSISKALQGASLSVLHCCRALCWNRHFCPPTRPSALNADDLGEPCRRRALILLLDIVETTREERFSALMKREGVHR